MSRQLPLYHLRLRLLARAIGRSVPFLNFWRRPAAWPWRLTGRRGLRPETLGALTAEFFDRRGRDRLPPYENQDWVPALPAADPTTSGELRLQAFMWGSGSSLFARRVLFLLGALLLPELWPRLRQDLRRGRQARARLKTWDFAMLAGEEIEALRRRLASASNE